MSRPSNLTKALVDLAIALHATRLAFDQKASTTEIISSLDLLRLRLDAVIDASGRADFAAEFRRWVDRLKG